MDRVLTYRARQARCGPSLHWRLFANPGPRKLAHGLSLAVFESPGTDARWPDRRHGSDGEAPPADAEVGATENQR